MAKANAPNRREEFECKAKESDMNWVGFQGFLYEVMELL